MSGNITAQERMLLKLLADGHTLAEAAEAMDRAWSTERNALIFIRKKMNVKTTWHAIAIAVRKGWA
ncbi:hypothetical protein KKH23_06775 [Patescibacteria group bacterium]|uniref:Putative LuxR-type DNA-binding HTH domain containing protein n=1 Tax=viral metagenome TaxID=1070528 RepID=A0A6M3LYT8_9ZZZZ|nr:hypothetical protein [Patescibacteria group bacterium]